MSATSHGRLDRDGRLLDAEPRLRALNDRAGGRVGAPIAVPGIAAVVRLALRLGVMVSRAVEVADGAGEIELWVRARPDATGLALAVGGWGERDARSARDADSRRAAARMVVETDAGLMIVRLAGLAHADALIGRPLTALLRLDEDAGGLPILAALGRRIGFSGQRATLKASDEAVLLSARPLLDADGGFLGFDAILEPDGPVVDRAEAGAAGLGAALRRPLDRILQSAEAMSADRAGGYQDYADDIAGAARHLIALVDDLVDLEAVERPDFAVPLSRVDLAQLARRAAGLLGVRAAEAGVRIDPPAADESVAALADPRRTLQILVNLVGNAVTHSPPGAMVWIRVEADAERSSVVVADQGRGIAPADQTRVFEKFERVEPAASGGSGLGLYIARALANAMGGEIGVDSAPGQGARFALSLPRAD